MAWIRLARRRRSESGSVSVVGDTLAERIRPANYRELAALHRVMRDDYRQRRSVVAESAPNPIIIPMSSHIERARLLINQSRYELATKELQKALADDPDDPVAHALMAVCLAERKRLTHDNDVNLCTIDHEFTYPQFRFM